MTLQVDKFKAKLIGGGARANLFKVTVNFPGYAGGDVELTSFMVKAASLPASTIGLVELPFRGRIVKLAGDRTFDPWSITIINDTGMTVRNAFEKWSNGINGNKSNTSLSNPADYQVDMSVDQLDGQGNIVKTYDIRGAWPSVISAIDVSNDSTNTIEEYTVEIQYDYWEAAGITS